MNDDIKDRLLEAADIVEIIGEVVELRKRGSNFTGLCPFHNEKTPSFSVSSEKGIYKCFGCGKAGNALTFMIDYHRMSFPEALKELSRRTGIQLPQFKDKESKEKLTKNELILNALDFAKNYYIKLLKSTAGKNCLQYFRSRGFSNELIKEFYLGYSPESWDSTMLQLKREGIPENILFEAGLTIKREEGNSYYDRFRGRAMFPIQNMMGKVIGFGARQLSDEPNQPKYINSPQSPVYDKSKTLYGLFQARSEIQSKNSAILTEGYADVLTLHQAGFKNSVASSGTSLTIEQLKLLGRYSKKLYIVYDADSAGIKAAERGLEMALENGFDVNIVTLPSGEDPDSLIRNHGGNTFKTYLSEALNFIDFKIAQYKKAGQLESPSGKADAIRSLIKIITSIPDRLQHDEYIARLAGKLNLTETQLRKVYKEKVLDEKKTDEKSEEKSKISIIKENEKSLELDDSQLKTAKQDFKKLKDSLLPEELLLLKFAIANQEALKLMIKKFKIDNTWFINPEAGRLLEIILIYAGDDYNPLGKIVNNENITDGDKDFFTRIYFDKDEFSKNWVKYSENIKEIDYGKLIMDCNCRLRLHKIIHKIDEIKQNSKIKPFEEQLDDLNKIKKLTKEKSELIKKIGME